MSRYDWNNPPPPGTEPEEDSPSSSVQQKEESSSSVGSDKLPRSYVEIEKPRARSRSNDRKRRHKRSRSRRSRSYSRERRRRSRSRRRHRRHSSSRSRSHSPGYKHRHRRSKRYSRSRSRSRRRTYRSRSRSHSRRDKRSPKKHPEGRYNRRLREAEEDNLKEEDMKIVNPDEEDEGSEEDDEGEENPVPFKNDGSFLEMFKKMQEEKAKEEPAEGSDISKKPVIPAFGKRRGGKVLKTGLVAKVRNIEEDPNNPQDAWSVYMKEVRKYKEAHCDDDSKTRPLVK